MKNLTLLLLMLLPLVAFAQSWAPVGAQWYYSQSEGGGLDYFYDYKLFEVTKDTIVQGKTASFIQTNGSSEIIYQDGQEVFYYQDGSFHKLYDFGAAVGDTVTFELRSYANENSTEPDTILAVQSVLEEISSQNGGTQPLKAFWYSLIPHPHLDHLAWGGGYGYVEGIGNMSHFMMTVALPGPIPNDILRCYESPSLSFTNPVWAQHNKPCDYAARTGLNAPAERQSLIIRQEGDWLHLNLEEPKGQYQIVTMTGKRISAGEVQQQVNVASLSSGLYVLIVSRKGEVLTRKFVKQ